MFKIKFPTKLIFRIFPILRTNGMAPFCNLFMERPSYYTMIVSIFNVYSSCTFVRHFPVLDFQRPADSRGLGSVPDPGIKFGRGTWQAREREPITGVWRLNFHLKVGVPKIVPAARIVRAAGLRKFVKFFVHNGAFFSHIFQLVLFDNQLTYKPRFRFWRRH